MDSSEQKLKAAVAAKVIPGAVCVAGNASGSFYYTHATGVKSLKDGAAAEPLPLAATMWLASSTKLMTSVSALQCVERGLFTLDEDVTRLLPEFKDIEILTGFEEGSEKPILVKATKKITLRHLLSHTSGLAYDVFNPLLQRWRKYRGEETHFTNGPLNYRCLVPLVFEPGELWEYSVGIDWAGQMVERATNLSLEIYMRTNIWNPLGISNITFEPENRPDLIRRLPETSERQGGVTLFGTAANPAHPVAYTADRRWPLTMSDNNGGAGCFGSLIDYQKIIHSLTTGDGRLLGPAMINTLFEPQLGEKSQAFLSLLLEIKELRDIMGVPEGVKVGHALGGVVVLENVEGRRKKGTMSWQGLPNVYWWADRTSGVSGVFGTQIVPTGDPKTIELLGEFEKSVYARLKMEK